MTQRYEETKLNAAVERLSCWVREYGDCKSKVFIDDLSVILNAARAMRGVSDGIEIGRRQAPEVVPNREHAMLKDQIYRYYLDCITDGDNDMTGTEVAKSLIDRIEFLRTYQG